MLHVILTSICNDIFGELSRNVSAEISYRIDALKFHERNEFILPKIFCVNINTDIFLTLNIIINFETIVSYEKISNEMFSNYL